MTDKSDNIGCENNNIVSLNNQCKNTEHIQVINDEFDIFAKHDSIIISNQKNNNSKISNSKMKKNENENLNLTANWYDSEGYYVR